MKLGKFLKAIKKLECVNPSLDIQFRINHMDDKPHNEIIPYRLYLWDEIENPYVEIEFIDKRRLRKADKDARYFFRHNFINDCSRLEEWMKESG